MHFLTTAILVMPLAGVLAVNCNNKAARALKSFPSNTKVCEYLHENQDQWERSGSRAYLPEGLKNFDPKEIFEACDCLSDEEHVEPPRGRYNHSPEIVTKTVTRTIPKTTTQVEREVVTQTTTETEIVTHQKTIYKPRTYTTTTTETDTVISCTATKTEALATTTTTVGVYTTTLAATKTETDYQTKTETETKIETVHVPPPRCVEVVKIDHVKKVSEEDKPKKRGDGKKSCNNAGPYPAGDHRNCKCREEGMACSTGHACCSGSCMPIEGMQKSKQGTCGPVKAKRQ